MNRRQDQFRGCLLGAAVGDALGFCVADMTMEEITEQYGPEGIQGYDSMNGWALVSSHTQMAMYTANALLFGATRGATRGRMAPYVNYIEAFYKEWATTQRYGAAREVGKHYGWITTIRELRCRRNPDNMTLFAAERPRMGTTAEPVNRSHHPIGVTRCIPIALHQDPKRFRPSEIRLLGAESAALSVGDPLGWLPAAYMTELLSRICYGKEDSLLNHLLAAHQVMAEQFGAQYPQLDTIRSQLSLAQSLAFQPVSPREAARRLRADDAASCLALAIYCCLRFPEDADRALVTAVNHGGNSAAAGFLTGALMGAMLGTSGIPDFYLEPLEMRNILEELADDLFMGCPMSRNNRLFDDQWDQKYVQCTW